MQRNDDDDIGMDEQDDDVKLESPTDDNELSDRAAIEIRNYRTAGTMASGPCRQEIQQGSQHQELEWGNQDNAGAMVFCPQLKRKSRNEYQRRVLADDTSGRDESVPSESNDGVSRLERPGQLLLEVQDSDNTTDSSIVVYGETREDSGSVNNEPPSKRSRLDSDVALMAEVAMTALNLPRSYEEAVNGPDSHNWNEAIECEFAAHKRNHTWTPVIRKPEMKPIGSKWVWAKKNDGRYKARLVALGFLQRYGVNFFETYAAVASMNSIRMLLSICCAAGYVIDQLDVDTAYLNADLEEEVYLMPPKGMKIGNEYVLKLNRALYALKQAANAWNKTIHNAMLEIGFIACGADRCIYKKKDGNGWAHVCLYVDDKSCSRKVEGHGAKSQESNFLTISDQRPRSCEGFAWYGD